MPGWYFLIFLTLPAWRNSFLGGFASHSRSELPPGWLLPTQLRWPGLCSHLGQLSDWQQCRVTFPILLEPCPASYNHFSTILSSTCGGASLAGSRMSAPCDEGASSCVSSRACNWHPRISGSHGSLLPSFPVLGVYLCSGHSIRQLGSINQ